MNFDLIIRNASVIDGTGKASTDCEIGIRDDIIERIGNLSAESAPKEIDAAGYIVCPGFIDSHSHSDAYLLIEPSAASKVHQGITTEICGNCGASAAPLNGNYKMPADWSAQLEAVGRARSPSAPRTARPSVPTRWRTFAEYRALYDEVRPAINAALLVGHNTLHAGICGYDPRGATCGKMKQMQRELAQALDEGAIGLSSGLAYPPGSAVPREELIELCRTVARHNGVYTTHMRSESGGLLDAIDEAIDIAERSGTRLQISHLKASGQSNWTKLDSAFEKIRAARNRIDIGSDRYPYTAGSTDLDVCLPLWATYGGRDAILARLREPHTRQQIRTELLQHPEGYWDNVMIGSTRFEELKGKYLPEAADALKMNEVDAFLHLIDADELATGGIFFSMSEENLYRVLAEPYVSLGSDGSMRAPTGPLSTDHPHPRSYGSHTRFLRAALDGQTVPLAEAIRKMTALPAAQFGLKNRGRIEEGCFADLIIFDPSEIRENTSYANPHQLSSGMQHVIVNGTHTLDESLPTNNRSGRFLSHP